MARYVYEGPAPADDGTGGVVKPLDIREFDAEPSWGPWRLLDDGDLQQPQEPPQAVPGPAPAGPVKPAPAPDPAPKLPATGTEG